MNEHPPTADPAQKVEVTRAVIEERDEIGGRLAREPQHEAKAPVHDELTPPEPHERYQRGDRA